MPPRIELRHLDSTSPTLWTQMRLCGLRAALAAVPAADKWVLHDPRLWLGIAFHEVMQAARSSAVPIVVSDAWDAAIARLASAASEHPLDRRYSKPETWPSYFLVRQRCLSLASGVPPRRLSTDNRRQPSRTGGGQIGAERTFRSFGGLLVGRPDFYDGTTIVDYKSNLPDLAWPGAALALDAIHRQMRLYAALIADATGVRPSAARVVAASGQTLDVPIGAAACDAEASAALGALANLNGKLSRDMRIEDIAAPAPANCAGCTFKMICKPFWDRLLSGGMHDLPECGMEGDFEAVQVGPDGDLYTAVIEMVGANRDIFSPQHIVLRESIHGKPLPDSRGQHCRAVAFHARSDRRCRADMSTVIASNSQLPSIVGPAETPKGESRD